MKKILLTDPIYNEYFYQLSELETKELELRIKEARLHTKVAACEETLKNMSTPEKSLSAIQREIDLYASLQTDLATKRETARATMELEKQRGENRIRIVGRSYPDKPIGLSPILIMILLWCVPPSCVVGMIFLVYLYRRGQLKKGKSRQSSQTS